MVIFLICLLALYSTNINGLNVNQIALFKTLTGINKFLSESDPLNEGTEVCLKEGVECPRGNINKYQKLANYSQYCQCSNGRPYLYSCPSGLVFNPFEDVCDYVKKEMKFVLGSALNERLANMLDREEVSQGSNVCSLEGLECPIEDDNFPVFLKLENSSLYCQCFDGSPYLFSCPPGQAFNIETSICDYKTMKNEAISGTRLRGNNATPDKLNIGTKICNIKDSGVVCPTKNNGDPRYFALENKSQFCECCNGRPYLFSCPDGEIFDMEINSCN